MREYDKFASSLDRASTIQAYTFALQGNASFCSPHRIFAKSCAKYLFQGRWYRLYFFYFFRTICLAGFDGVYLKKAKIKGEKNKI